MGNDDGNDRTNSTATTRNFASKRPFKPRLPPLSDVISSDQVAIRLLCRLSKSGAIIGKSGTIVKLMEQETGAKIRIENIVPYCEERLITIIASESPKKTIVLKSSNSVETEGNGVENGEEVEVSPAQHGLIRVLQRILEVEAETEEFFPSTGLENGVATCRLLTDASHIGYLMGKGGRKIKKIEDESGANIRVSVERCPPCALETDELIQIRGDSLAVKKAVLAVSQCLQESPFLEGSKPLVAAPNGAFAEPYSGAHQNPFLHPRVSSSVDNGSRSYSMPAEEEVVFRLLCSNDNIGGVIGKGGTIVKALQDETGASISVAAPVAESDDRVIHISALENVESRHSPAQNAVIRVFTKSIGNKKRLESGAKAGARLLVPSDQIGCLIGKGGNIISEMRKATRTSMWVLQDDQVPLCAAENDTVVQINGGLLNVQNALFIVTGRLRDTFFPYKMPNAAGRIIEPTSSGSCPSMDFSYKLGRQATLTESMNLLGLSQPLDHPLSPKLRKSRMKSGESWTGVMDTGRGGATLSGGLEHGSGSKFAVVKNTTLETRVPQHVLGSVYGDKESNLNRVRQISGAKVTVQEPFPGTSEATIIISGTPDQTQAAQSVLHAFIFSS